ncbi:glutamate--tRNA ligase [Desulfocurvibacter africanus]|uniref:glutamate--tRNA ligase n=1 Tax=Desulfocurvibacter africanus TaxID=873 RepID=UPI0004042206|nr:glutamate--tRNA ligase [Desulfocurvibacter africanus]
MKRMVTRFAPSPTGYLHVGGARTAIFNWLLARHNQGRFILRIEDTDRERSTPEATQAILDGMSWLGLDWDELHYQSQRAELHNEYIDRMVASGHAYWCSCTPQQVDAMREKATAEGRKPKYDLTCRERGLGPGPGRCVRLKAPLVGSTGWTDLVKGHIAFPNEELDDLVLRRSDGSPIYNVAVVVDDITMGVTTIIRGDDHVSNTPKQILIYQALGAEMPEFGHVPMILGPDKKKLSKRHGATSVVQYQDEGYLPEAMVNYLLRLGWSLGDKEIFSRQEMVELFTTANLGSSPAVFDQKKLNALNAHYIKESAPERLAGLLLPFFAAKNLAADAAYVARIVPMFQPRAQTLKEMADKAEFFLLDDAALEYDQAAVQKFITEATKPHLAAIREGLAGLPDFSESAVEELLNAYVAEKGVSFKDIAQPLRVALTGKTASPGLHETIAALGRDKVLNRLEQALKL